MEYLTCKKCCRIYKDLGENCPYCKAERKAKIWGWLVGTAVFLFGTLHPESKYYHQGNVIFISLVVAFFAGYAMYSYKR